MTTPAFWPHTLRGSERIVHDVAVSMRTRGHAAEVVTRAPSGRASYAAEVDGIPVRYRADHPGPRGLLGLDAMEGFAVTAARWALTADADVLHAFHPADAYGLHLATRLRRRPYIFSWHGVPGRAWWEREHPRMHRWYVRVMESAAAVTVMTEASAEAFRADYGRDAVVLTPGIFTADYAAPRRPGRPGALGRPGAPVIACSARADDERKRVDVLVAAFAEVATAESELRLLLLGPSDAGRMESLLSGLEPGLRARVEWRAEPDLPDALAGCAMGALTSRGEALGLVVLEYLAAGLPVLVSDDAGAAMAVTPATGRTFREGDARSCAAALREVLELGRREDTEAACRAAAAGYDWAVRADAYEQLYRSVVA